MKKLCFKFSWQLGSRQIQCDLCKKWWTQDSTNGSPGDAEFSCLHKGGFCGIECLACRELLEVGDGKLSCEGTEDVVLARASRLSRHFQASPKCVPDARALACLLADLEDSIPWRAVAESRTDAMAQFRSACLTVTSYAGVGAALLWLVRSLQRDAVHAEHLPHLEALAARLRDVEGAACPADACRTRGRSGAAGRPGGAGEAQAGPAQHGAGQADHGGGGGASAADAAGEAGGGGDEALVGTRAERRRQRELAAAGLAAAMAVFADEHVLDWVGMETLNRVWERSATGWVASAVLEQEAGFRYTRRSTLAHGGLSELRQVANGARVCYWSDYYLDCLGCYWSDAWRVLSDLRQVAAKMQLAHQRCDPPGYCPDCAGSGRNPGARDEDCGTCLGLGVVSGDSPFKRQLADGPPFRLRVRPAEEGKGLGVFAEEDIEAGEAVCEYVGEVISVAQARARERDYAARGLFYMFEPRQLAHTMARWVTDATRQVTPRQAGQQVAARQAGLASWPGLRWTRPAT
jgi:hypothetical protein